MVLAYHCFRKPPYVVKKNNTDISHEEVFHMGSARSARSFPTQVLLHLFESQNLQCGAPKRYKLVYNPI